MDIDHHFLNRSRAVKPNAAREHQFLLIMKNSILFFALTTLLFFASCTKESILQPEQLAATDTETMALIAPTSETEEETKTASANGSSVDVSKITSSISGNQLTANFSSAYDFTGEDLEAVQTLNFTDGTGKQYKLNFGVVSYSGSDGSLQVVFSIEGNDLNGLGMDVAQGIVIEDDLAI